MYIFHIHICNHPQIKIKNISSIREGVCVCIHLKMLSFLCCVRQKECLELIQFGIEPGQAAVVTV